MSAADHRDQKAQEVIRGVNERLGFKTWGFVTYRCTYTSQEKWDKFMTLLQQEAQYFLRDEKDKDVLDTLTWPVVEDEKELDGADYKTVRARHDRWVDEELRKEVEEGRDRKNIPAFLNVLQRFNIRVFDNPRFSHFIFADEDVVNSVVDHHEAEQRKKEGLYYYIKLVQTGLALNIEIEDFYDEDEEDEEQYPDDEDSRRYYWQRFKAWDIVRLYASILRGGWPDHHAEKFGVCEIMGL